MISYKIKTGDSISTIANRFGFDDWHPIWIYNKQFAPEPRLKATDPRKIPTDAIVYIPRTKDQYNLAIAKLTELYHGVVRDGLAQSRLLEADWKSTQHVAKIIDTTASVAIAFASVARVAVTSAATLSARYASYRVGKELIKPAQKLAEYFLPEDEDEDEDGPRVAVTAGTISAKSVVGATQEQSIHLFAGRGMEFGRFGRDFVKDAAEDAAKSVMKGEMKKAGSRATDSDQFVDLLCGVLEKGARAIEDVKPSWIAQKILEKTTGENPEDTYRRAQELLATSLRNSKRRVQESILTLKKERDAMYPKSQP